MKRPNQNLNFTKIAKYFNKQSFFCFTSDVDWAPELVIAKHLKIFDELKIPLTLFVTHSSKVIKKAYQDKKLYVGLHPNFLSGSSHGKNLQEQIETVQKIWPEARSFRSHCYFDHFYLTEEFIKRKFKYDSNLCLFLQPYISPLKHQSGLVRFPVFWEDDIHLINHLAPNITSIKKNLALPGLKIFNFHPLMLVLNVPSLAYYQKRKFLYQNQDLAALEKEKYPGRGLWTFFDELVEYLSAKKAKIGYLDDLYEHLKKL